jgi:serine/threonine protein phosphatase PrpC
VLATTNLVTHAAGESFVGRRDNNEDSFRVRDDLGLYLVADGMGGHEGGEIASRLTADALITFFESGDTLPEIDDHVLKVRMGSAIRGAVKKVETAATGDLVEMGTTLAALLIHERLALIAHVGDSRVYRLRESKLDCLTIDHSFLNELDPERADELVDSLPEQFSAMVTRCIAADANTQPDLLVEKTEDGDRYLLCSDGLTDVMTDDEIEQLMVDHPIPSEASSALIKAAFGAGSQDNITCVVVQVPPSKSNAA